MKLIRKLQHVYSCVSRYIFDLHAFIAVRPRFLAVHTWFDSCCVRMPFAGIDYPAKASFTSRKQESVTRNRSKRSSNPQAFISMPIKKFVKANKHYKHRIVWRNHFDMVNTTRLIWYGMLRPCTFDLTWCARIFDGPLLSIVVRRAVTTSSCVR